MADTRGLLDRISAFRQRLEQMPRLIPEGIPMDEPRLLAGPSTLESESPSYDRVSTAMVNESPLPPRLTARAHRLLLDARSLIEFQKQQTDDSFLAGLVAESAGMATATVDPVVRYHRGTIGLTESAIRMVQSFPSGVESQLRGCDGLESLLTVVRHRLGILDYTVQARKNDRRRVDQLATLLRGLHQQRPVTLASFMELAEEILDDARQALRIRWLGADPLSTESGNAEFAAARFVASHAINMAQVMARLVRHDYEWAAKPAIPVLTCLLMDVGMLSLPGELLAKTADFTLDDRRQIEAHPRKSAELIRKVLPETGPLADVIEAHHEHLDGTGFPAGKRAEQIPPLSRFVAAVDFYAKPLLERPGHPSSDPRTALTDTLMAAEQGRLDRDFTEYLLNLSFHPVGTVVELVDGRLAVVAANHSSKVNLRASARPVVAVLTDPQGHVMPRPEFIDLASSDRGGIVRVVSAQERREKLSDSYPDLC